MVTALFDRVCETSTTTGTGDLTLAGAITGYQTFDTAGVTSTAGIPYLVEAVDTGGNPTGDWEAGIGLLSAPTTLQRTVVTASSNAGSAVSFAAGTKRVHLAFTAMQANLVGGSWSKTADLTGQNFTTATALTWNHMDWDTDPTNIGFHSNSTNPSRIVLPPAGYDNCKVRLFGQVALANITVADYVELTIKLDGATIIGRSTGYVATTTPCFQIDSGMLFGVGGGDYFELLIKVGADTSVDVVAAQSRFQLEVMQ